MCTFTLLIRGQTNSVRLRDEVFFCVKNLVENWFATTFLLLLCCVVRRVDSYDDLVVSVYNAPKGGDAEQGYPFTRSWMEDLATGSPGCNSAKTGHFDWRVSGLGCNMNLLLSAWQYWAYAFDYDSLAIITGEHFDNIQCPDRSRGADVSGFHCIFEPMPHLCTFRTIEDYAAFLAEQGATSDEIARNIKITNEDTWRDPRPGHNWMSELHPTSVESRQATAQYMWDHFQPWVYDDLRALRECSPTGITEGPYVAIHVRRGDKLKFEAVLTPTETYLDLAAKRLEWSQKSCTGSHEDMPYECVHAKSHLTEDVKGIFIASDDRNVVDEIRSLSSKYFPNVEEGAIVYLSNGATSGCSVGAAEMVTRVWKQDYLGMLYLLYDINQMVGADLFVGTFSSNLGRFVTTMRGNESSIGAEPDRPRWKPN